MENENKTVWQDLPYTQATHKWGKIWGFGILFLIVIFPITVAIIFQALPDWGAFGTACLAVIPTYWAVGCVEIITYVPMLGAGGSYLSFVTGNISNLKLPCALDSMNKAGVKATSEEGEIISTISIAVSSIVTTVIIIIGVCCIVPLTPILENPVLQPAFNQILPALFGGLAVVFVAKNWKIAILPIIIMLILFIFVDKLNSSTVGIMVPVGVVITLIEARIMYKKGIIGNEPQYTQKEETEVTENKNDESGAD